MKYVAALDTEILGVAYLADQFVDVSTWSRRTLVRFLQEGQIAPVSSSLVYVHTQEEAATVWTVNHDLGYDPAGVVVMTSDGHLADEWGLQYLTPKVSLRLSFDIPVSGFATFS